MDSYTKTLLHFDGSLQDETGRVWDGTPNFDTTNKKFGIASFLATFSTTTTTANMSDFSCANVDCTIDFWMKYNVADTYASSIIFGSLVGKEYMVYAGGLDTKQSSPGYGKGKICIGSNTQSELCTSRGVVDTNEFTHIAIVKYQGITTFYANGYEIMGVVLQYFFGTLSQANIGESLDGIHPLYSNIDEFRFSKGIARWTSNFIPPGAPYTLPGAFISRAMADISGTDKQYVLAVSTETTSIYMLVVDSSTGNVGIATASPAEKLEVNGNIKASNDIYASNFHGDGSSLTGIISSGTLRGTDLQVGNNVAGATGNFTGAVAAASFVGNGSSLTGLTKAQVGLGNVQNVDATHAANITSGILPLERLDATYVTLQGNTFNGANQLLQLNSSAKIPATALPSGGYDSSYLKLDGSNAMSGQLTVNSTATITGNAFSVGATGLVVNSGNVGIGTSSPTTVFDIVASSPAVILTNTNSAGLGQFNFYENTAQKGQISVIGSANSVTADRNMLQVAANNGDIGFYPANSQVMRLSASQVYISTGIKIADGTQGAGKVLVSDSNGVASWQTGGYSTLTGTQTFSGQNTFTQLINGSVSGNAGTVTNGVYTNGSYSNPAWLTSISTSKVDLSTVTAALNGKLSNTAAVPTALLDFSTITAALNGKQATGNYALTTGQSFTGNISAPNVSATYGVSAATGNFTATGLNNSITTSSSVYIQAGGLKLPDGTVLVSTAGLGGTINYVAPIGSYIDMSSTTCPADSLAANGASVSTTTYSAYFAQVGYTYGGSGANFNLPNFNGLFARAFDVNNSTDTGRAFGSYEADAFKAHTHTELGGMNTMAYGGGSNWLTISPAGTTASPNQTASTGGVETRPMNLSVEKCVVVFNATNLSSGTFSGNNAIYSVTNSTFTGSSTIQNATITITTLSSGTITGNGTSIGTMNNYGTVTNNVYTATGTYTAPQTFANQPWTTWTPTLTCASGSLGSATATGSYMKFGHAAFIEITVTITTLGTCGGSWFNASMPFTTVLGGVLAGRDGITGHMIQGVSNPGYTAVFFLNYDNSFVGSSGDTIYVSGILGI